ncbi:GNAT family N-acetyltransferase [Rhodococcoides corynebacterioides]|uniref:GNAT family N-acetyltransferase n=1 Tax=Rhodococcoides corynebacterioides TaxID=53972 RepID=UPI000834C1F4|nr:GNAT family N-acetyltransferase [Rhodococcus corynebacterioides]
MTGAATVRPADPSEIPQLAALAARTFPLACPPGTEDADIRHFVSTALSENAFRGYLADDERRVLIAERDGTLVGYTMLGLRPSEDPDVRAAVRDTPAVEVNKMYADPAAHGSGAAGALMQAAVDLARELGRASLWLGVNHVNARAQAFYRKCGFVPVGQRRFALGDVLHEDFVYERVL